MKPTAVITGITGQDGSYLAEFLLEKGYAVVGIARRSSIDKLDRLTGILDKITIEYGDITDLSSISRIFKKHRPQEVYNLAAQSFVATSWEQPLLTGAVTALGAGLVLEAVRLVDPSIKFYQASSSEMFGRADSSPQNEQTAFRPRSPYAVSKVYAHYLTINYRESFDMFAVNGILFNHESPRRGMEFVTRKISHTVAKIHLGLADKLAMGDLTPRRDWGFAGDYVKAMWMMMQQDIPDDFVIASGQNHSVADCLRIAFERVDKDYKDYVVQDERFMRPAEVHELMGDYTKAREKFGWEPTVKFEELINMMIDADIERLSKTA